MPGEAGASGNHGTCLRLARQARGFSQQQLAGMAGVSRQFIVTVESGKPVTSLRTALALARALGLSVEELFGPGTPVPPSAPGRWRRLVRQAPGWHWPRSVTHSSRCH